MPGGLSQITVSMRTICFFLALQLVLLAFYHRCVTQKLMFLEYLTVALTFSRTIRYSGARARDMFLTTYYDPFYPDLHLHAVKPDLLRHSILSSSLKPSISFTAIPARVDSLGLWAALAEISNNATAIVADWQRAAWETWGAPSSTMSWPPT
jgi:hypothetical protein